MDQHQRLLDTALTLFARHGIAETTLSAIAREAGMTPAMMHYYFKSRDQLLDVLIEERLHPVRLSIGNLLEAHADDPAAAMTALVHRLMATATEHTWFAPLWIREVISESGMLKQRLRKRGDMHQKSMLHYIARWQEAGLLRADVEPSLMATSIFGLTLLPMTATKTWRDDPIRKPLDTDAIAQHAAALLLHGIINRTPARSRK